MSNINFFQEEITFQLKEESLITDWLQTVATAEHQSIEEINYIFCNDEYLLSINREYLNHDYYTDIITFDNRDNKHDSIEADIFISIDRVKENAQTLQVAFDKELSRVMVHGLLHLLGYHDKSEEEISQMREKEEAYLSLQKL
uniref:rRNA maturation RNase YbeY n=1 Tax=Roseivirga sp. TaxID=1964215 RepID=UPI0040480F0A